MLRMESPPSSKKSSWAPTRGMRSTLSQTRQSVSSTAFAGATKTADKSARSASSGAGKARRSTLPLTVIGSAGRSTKPAGIM